MKSVRSSVSIEWTGGESAISAILGIRTSAGSSRMYSS